MTSLGVPRTGSLSPTLDGPRYGILLNPHEAPPCRGRSTDKVKINRAPPPPAVRIMPVDVPSKSPSLGDTQGVTTPGVESPRIRFAPLPDPLRTRSLSTGRNIGITSSEGENGEREFHIELRNMGGNGDYENALDDEDADDDGDDGGDYSDDDGGRRKSWAVSMGSMGKSSWKGTKKLLGASTKPKDEELGAPLKKSVSSGGITHSSPFKWTGSGDSSLFGTSPRATTSMLTPRRGSSASAASAASATAHRRGSSGDLINPSTNPNPNPLLNPKPARMLNGRMYGARRASEAAALEKERREKAEPSFVEWGAGGAGTVAKSLGPVSTNKEDNDDGGGMAWVKRRREERRAREQAEAAAAGAGGNAAQTETAEGGEEQLSASPAQRPASLSSSVGSSSPAEGPSNGPLTPHEPSSELHSFNVYNGFQGNAETAKPPHDGDVALDNQTAGIAAEHDSDHHTHAVSIPNSNSQYRRQSNEVDDDDEEEDDGDFDNDDEDEEELLAGMGGMCASAAGVEILSRHKN